MKSFLFALVLVSTSAFADERNYSCVSDTNLPLFTYGESREITITATPWAGKGYFHVSRGEFPIFLEATQERGFYVMDTQGFGGAKAGTVVKLSNEILSFKLEESIVSISLSGVGEQVYFCQPAE